MTESARPPDDVIAIVADLHLAGGDEDDPFCEDARFVATVEDLVSIAGERRLRLVFLGDTFDFAAVTGPGHRLDPATLPTEALGKFEGVVAGHKAVLEVLRDVARAGHRLDFVAGNHDMELLFPGVQGRLLDELRGGPGQVELHPWILHVPGVLYAEHGQQHHDFNRYPWLGTTLPEVDRGLAVPAGSYLDALAHLRARRAEASTWSLAVQGMRMGVGLLGALAALGRAERRRSERERRLASTSVAGLPSAAVLGIDRAAAATPASIARRAASMAVAVSRRSRADEGVPFMLAAAQAVHQVLQAEGCEVPFYVFGHTHVVADVALSADGSARYLNPGTWSTTTRRVPGGDRRFGVVIIERTAETRPRAWVYGPV